MEQSVNGMGENNKEYCLHCFWFSLILQLILHWVRSMVLGLVSLWLANSEYLYFTYNISKIILTAFAFAFPAAFYLRLTKRKLSDIIRLRENAKIYRAKEEKTPFGVLFFIFAATVTLNIANLAGMATDGVCYLLGIEVSETVLSPSWQVLILSFISAVILAPLCEELLFRGVALNALAPYGLKWTVFISGVTFALMHHSFYSLFYAFCAGGAIAFFAYISGSFRVAVGLHFVNNLLTYLTAAVRLFFGPSVGQTCGYVLLAVTLPVAIVGATVFIKKKIWRSSLDGGGNCEVPNGSQNTEARSPVCIEAIFYVIFALIGCFG